MMTLLALCSTRKPLWAQTPTSNQAQKRLRQQNADETLQNLRLKDEQKRLKEVQAEYERTKNLGNKERRKRQAKTAGPRFLVKRILVSKSGVLLKDEISEVLEKYEGKYLNIVELQSIVYDLNRLYRGQKGSLSRALLPPQKIKDGVVRIILIESKMGRVIYQSSKLTYLNYLRWALPITTNTVTNVGDLEDIFTRFNRTHNSVRVSSQLRPGSGYSETDIIIKVNEINRWTGVLFLDNEGTTPSDRIRYGTTIQNNSLLGIDDQLMVGGTKSLSHSSRFASYDFPFTSFSTRFRGLYSKNKQSVEEENFSELDITGNTEIWSGKITHPFVANKIWKTEMGFEINQSSSTNKLSIFELKNISRQYIASLNISRYDSRGAWIAGVNFHNSLNRDIVNNTHSDREWSKKWTSSLTRYQSLTPQLSLSMKASGQYTSQFPLPSSEQFNLGGDNNLAYESAEFRGDLGYTGGIELKYDTYWEDYFPELLQPSRFKINLSLQHGRVITYLPNGNRIDEKGIAQSLSLGLEAQVTSHFHGLIALATPIGDDPSLEKKTRSLMFKIRISF